MRARESKVRERGLPTTEYWNVCRGGGEVGGEVEGGNNTAYLRGGVVLRREQVRLVLFEGKSVVQDRPLSKGKFHTSPRTVYSHLLFDNKYNLNTLTLTSSMS